MKIIQTDRYQHHGEPREVRDADHVCYSLPLARRLALAIGKLERDEERTVTVRMTLAGTGRTLGAPRSSAGVAAILSAIR